MLKDALRVVNIYHHPNEFPQRAEDPWTCFWAEFYFMAMMSDAYLLGKTGTDLSLYAGQMVIEQGGQAELVGCMFIEKSLGLDNVPYGGEVLSHVRLGQPTGLILHGKEDIIIVPANGEYVTKRRIDMDEGLSRLDERAESRTADFTATGPNLGKDKYVAALHQRVLEAKKLMGAASYESLYAGLKAYYLQNGT